MILLELAAVPNQTFSVTINDNVWDVSIQQAQGTNIIRNQVVQETFDVLMSSTISLNNEVLQQGMRILPGQFLLPFRYEENGNFILLTADDKYPDYRDFGITQFLYYASAIELIAIRQAAQQALYAGV
jgi:hypothetical protein